MKTQLIRLPRLMLISFGVFLILSGLLYYGIYNRRRQPAGYTCFFFDEAQGRFLVDVESGVFVRDRREQTIQPSLYREYVGGRYAIAVQEYTPNDYTRWQLILEPTAGGRPIPITDRLLFAYTYAVAPGATPRLYFQTREADSSVWGHVVDVAEDGSLIESRFSLPNQAGYWRWSDDGTILVNTVNIDEGNFAYVWRASDRQSFAYTNPQPWSAPYIFFQPDEDVMIIQNTDQPPRAWVSILKPDGRKEGHLLLDSPILLQTAIESPDEQWLALDYSVNYPHRYLDLLSADGRQRQRIAEFNEAEVAREWFVWVGESRFYYTVVRGRLGLPPSPTWDILGYDMAAHQPLEVARGLRDAPSPEPTASQPQRWAVTFHDPDETQRVVLMNIDGAAQTTLVKGADDAGAPYWSGDGSRVAVVWAKGKGAERLVYLTTARRDGSEQTTYHHGFWDYRELRWLDSTTLAFISWGGEGQPTPLWEAHRLDVISHEQRALTQEMREITLFLNTSPKSRLSFWWRDGEGNMGMDAYTYEGTRLWRYVVSGEGWRPIDGVLDRSGMFMSSIAGDPKAFPLADFSLATLKLGPYRNEGLYLAHNDGSPALPVAGGLYGLGDPLWSPDGKLFAYTYSKKAADPIGLRILTAEGNQLWDIDVARSYANLTWTPCQNH
ncbi:MAG TPA: hypothetical protein PLD47_04270 [Aggregatilineales bacterium]|nr:PD40 domain-containing protein [Anaerolineales bacterium]HRE46917.1 hypothetical protein [Aggregatilineales bacterium]